MRIINAHINSVCGCGGRERLAEGGPPATAPAPSHPRTQKHQPTKPTDQPPQPHTLSHRVPTSWAPPRRTSTAPRTVTSSPRSSTPSVWTSPSGGSSPPSRTPRYFEKKCLYSILSTRAGGSWGGGGRDERSDARAAHTPHDTHHNTSQLPQQLFAAEVGYPVLVRPSFVLSGAWDAVDMSKSG